MGYTDNDNTVCLLRREPQNIGKIQVKRYQTSLLGTTDFIKTLVGTALQILVPDSHNVVPLCPE